MNSKKQINLPINMYDPTRDYHKFQKEYMGSINKVLEHGRFINGPEVKELEKRLCEFTGTKYCITVGNGTDALQIALMSLGVGVGDEIITTPHTWISTSESIAILGAVPVFVDIDEYYNLDPDRIEEAITDKTKAILPVSLYGQAAQMDRINEIAEKYNLFVIEDAAQSFGSTFNGRFSCNLSDIAITSFFPTKPLGCYGDGGACFTNNEDTANKIRAIKNHGCLIRFQHKHIGMNSRLDTIQAAVLLIKLGNLNTTLANRNKVASFYLNNLKPLQDKGIVVLPKIQKNTYHVWAQFPILLKDKGMRDFVYAKLKEFGVNTAIFYPVPLHFQECFNYLGYKKGDFPVTENVCDTIINLPIYGELNDSEIMYVCKIFKELIIKYVK